MVYRANQPFYITKQEPRDFVVVRANVEPSFFIVTADPAEDHMVSSEVWSGRYTQDVTNIVQYLIADWKKRWGGLANKAEAPLFVDVGSNLGWFTLMAASSGMDVRAFDPQERVMRFLRMSVSMLEDPSRVKLFNAAVSPEGGTVNMVQNEHNFGGTHVSKEANGGVAVTTDKIDTAVEQGGGVFITRVDAAGHRH